MNAAPDLRVAVDIGGGVQVAAAQTAGSVVDFGDTRVLFLDGEPWKFGPPASGDAVGGAAVSDGAILSPMPGRVAAVDVSEGDPVTKGQRLATVEAMKMELALVAPFDGLVERLSVSLGSQLREGDLLLRIVKNGRSQLTLG
jgi:3-methylcrotonyl-CoA carboxylase alpha subunit